MKATELKRFLREIERMRKALGWSQAATAERLGIPLATYRRWLAGESQPSRLALDYYAEHKIKDVISELRRLAKQIAKTLDKIESLQVGGEIDG